MEWIFQAASYPGNESRSERASFGRLPDHRIARGRRCTSPLYNHRASACQTVSMPRGASSRDAAAVAVLFLRLHGRGSRVRGTEPADAGGADRTEHVADRRATAVTPITPASTSTTTTELLPKEKTTPSAADPAELYVAGDSDAGTFGPYLEQVDATDRHGHDQPRLQGVVGSQPPRLLRLAGTLRTADPCGQSRHRRSSTFGGNDAQGLAQPRQDMGGRAHSRDGQRRHRLACRVRQARRSRDGLPRWRQPHADLGRHPQRRQPGGHRAIAGAERGRHGRSRQAAEGRVHRHLEAVLGSQRRLCRGRAGPARQSSSKMCGPTTASTSTRPAPRSSPSTSPKPSAPSSEPAAATSNPAPTECSGCWQSRNLRLYRMFRDLPRPLRSRRQHAGCRAPIPGGRRHRRT